MPFEYEALAEGYIRVLKFPKNVISAENSIPCELKIRRLNDEHGFEALSYCWGSPKDLTLVEIDGRKISMSQNLRIALQHVREDEKKTLLIWADGICINQDDKCEKDAQVPLMGEIYDEAKVVRVFLGPGTEKGHALLREINRIGEMASNAKVRDLEVEELMSLLDAGIDHSSNETERAVWEIADRIERHFPWESYNDFTKLDYWKRIWVFQEFCITAECRIMLGHEKIDFKPFAAAHNFLIAMSTRTLDRLAKENRDLGLKISEEKKQGNEDNKVSQTMSTEEMNSSGAPVEQNHTKLANLEKWEQQIQDNMDTIQAISTSEMNRIVSMIGARKGYQTKSKNRTLIRLLERCYVIASTRSNREATRHEDKVKGLLGLASDLDKLKLPTESWNNGGDVASIFTEVTSILLQHGYIDILAWSQMPKSPANLPSWVSDFGAINASSLQITKGTPFSASGQSKVSWTGLPKERFSIKGVKVDEILQLGSEWAPESTDYSTDLCSHCRLVINNRLWKYLQSASVLTNSAKAAWTNEVEPKAEWTGKVKLEANHWEEAFWKIPCGDQLYVGNERQRIPSEQHELKAYGTLLQELCLYESLITYEARRELNLQTLIPALSYEQQKQVYASLVSNEEMLQYRRAIDLQKNRQLFQSQHGYIGLVPIHAEEGDLVVILFGAKQPFVLRKCGSKYKLVGEAYVHGIMDGEFLLTKTQEEDFELDGLEPKPDDSVQVRQDKKKTTVAETSLLK